MISSEFYIFLCCSILLFLNIHVTFHLYEFILYITFNIKEIILAIKSGIEADTTSLYLKKILENKNVSITKIASGIPIGGDLDYVDSLTLESAIKNRKEVL